MTGRSLRPRKKRPSYTLLAGLDGNGDDEPAGASRVFEEIDSGSDFAPEQDIPKPSASRAGDHTSDAIDSDTPQVQNLPSTSTPTRQAKKAPVKGKATYGHGTSVPPLPSAGGLLGAARRHMYTLPVPILHHRHRPPPLYYLQIPTLRLAKPPEPFMPPILSLTNSFLHSQGIARKLSKAWGHSIGPGPVWELLEDRGWFKEATLSESNVSETNRRPMVYPSLELKSGLEVLDEEQGSAYLPADTTASADGLFKPPQPVPCHLGKFGNQQRVEVHMFQSLSMADFIPGSKSHVFNAGAPVWALDWCPVHPDDREARGYKQYLAVAPLPSRSYSPEIGVRIQRPMQSCIQIWAFSRDATLDAGRMICEMILCLQSGPAHELKWCPLPCHDMVSEHSSTQRPRKLGLLAGTFEDGSFSVFIVPNPLDVRSTDTNPSQPVYVRLEEPIVRIELPDSCCWCFDWANSELVAIGTTSGSIAVYNLARFVNNMRPETPTPITDIRPTHFITIHQSAIRALTWIRTPPSSADGEICTNADPTIIASGGYDGSQCLTDIRDVTGYTINRTRDVITSVTYSPYCPGPVSTDHENVVKAFAISPAMLGRGHTLIDPDGPPWSVHASDYHPMVALGSADGSCCTTNALRPPRRGTVPYFIHKLYQLDYCRRTGEWRMLDCLLPEDMRIMPPVDAKGQKGKQAVVKPTGTDAWPKEVGVHQVVWNNGNGFQGASMLASATASGLCRIDIPSGRWHKDRIPYQSIPLARGEVAADGEADVDMEDEISD